MYNNNLYMKKYIKKMHYIKLINFFFEIFIYLLPFQGDELCLVI